MRKQKVLLAVFMVWILVSLGCSLVAGGGDGGDQAVEPQVDEEPGAPQSAGPGTTDIRQWGASALASSEYGSDDWSARQATGAPNTPECGDFVTAWASSNSNTVETLTVYYDTAVYANQITVYESYSPDQVVKIEVIDLNGTPHQVFSQLPRVETNICPYLLKVDFAVTDFLVNAVRLTMDQSVTESWNEIDAVELVGLMKGVQP